MVVSLVNEKGGVGKTTIATNLACFYARKGKNVLLVDADPQGTALQWHDSFDGPSYRNGEVACVSLPTPDLEQKLPPLYRAVDVLLIDTPGTLSKITVATIKASDLVLLPVQPSAGDLWAVQDAVEIIQERRAIAGSPDAAFLISSAKVRTNLTAEIGGVLEEEPFDTLSGRTHNREVYKRAIGSGKCVYDLNDKKAASEITAIGEQVTTRISNND